MVGVGTGKTALLSELWRLGFLSSTLAIFAELWAGFMEDFDLRRRRLTARRETGFGLVDPSLERLVEYLKRLADLSHSLHISHICATDASGINL